MRTIDGIKYISAKEYAEMMNLTVGRVSQIKAELPFVKFEEFGIELINFDLLSLSQHEKALAQTKFQTATPIHQLSYKDLGTYFGKFVMDLVTFKGAADSQIADLQGKITDIKQKFEVSENEKAELSNDVSKLALMNKNLYANLEQEKQRNEQISLEFDNLKTIHENLITQLQEVTKELQDLKIVYSETKHEIEIKIIENKNFVNENENLKARLTSLELSAKNDADFREEFKSFKELVMKKIN